MALRIDSDLLAKEEAWQLGYGRFKYCGLREDPFGKPPDLQAPAALARLPLPDVDARELQGVRELQRRVSDIASVALRSDFCTLLRFFQEGQGDVGRAEACFREAVEWQKKHDVPRALTHWNLALFERCLAPWWPTGGFLGLGFEGEPVALERIGCADWTALHDNVPYDVLQKMDIVHCLRTLAGVEEDSLRRNVPFVNATLIEDLQGISWRTFSPRTLQALGAILKSRNHTVPRSARRVLIINAPAAFAAVWNTLKHILVNPHTASLMQIASAEESLKVLRQHMDDSIIPEYLGGTRSISGDPECRSLLAPGGTPPEAVFAHIRRLNQSS
ncbi:retm [Symbiodinium pilosum]|uniref:Retm protein n=1 Tax=Symbiodinium pilosum TaxID=2952 RepID=A0A812XFU6_SYMPI|nr:retm [Symbiodinium pilosum]